MALFASPFIKVKPYPSLPVRFLKTLKISSLVLNFPVNKNPKTFHLKTKCKQQSLSFFACSDEYGRNIAAQAVGSNESLLFESETQATNDVIGNRILASDVVKSESERNVLFVERKRNPMDFVNAGIVSSVHLLSLFAPFYFNWSAFWVGFGLYVITGLGITLSFHRNLSHRSFKLPKWLEYLFAYCGAHALQGDPIDWVSTHRHHHQFCDTDKDPHSPIEGFWHCHMGWIFDNDSRIQKCGGQNNVTDLEKQPFYKFLQHTYFLHPISLAVLLHAMGGFPFLVWGMGVRTMLFFHVTWLVNSAGHTWGNQAWNSGDLSTNNWWLALLVFGEGWHNNHHAFEYSARHGLEWWQIDITWYVVRFLESVGLATDVKVPNEAQKGRMAFNN